MGQSVTEARFVLRDVKRHLPGSYDNEPQIFVESAFGAGEDGNHGWYWLNIEEEPITITLEVHGYYERIDELFRSYQ